MNRNNNSRVIVIIYSMLIIILSQNITYATTTQALLRRANNIMTWQLEHGGWTKDKPEIYTRPWDEIEDKSNYYQQDGVTPLGTIDNGATISELEILAKAYDQTRKPEIRESFIKGIDFLLKMQYDSGGFPQVFPKQDAEISSYENMVTYNDNAMINVMYLFRKIINQEVYYGDELIDSYLRDKVEASYYKGIDYILASQILVDGQRTVWGGQHDPYTYETVQGRIFEPRSLISKESIDIIYFLETAKPQTPLIESSVASAKSWVRQVALIDTRYERYGIDGEYFVYNPGHLTWYRFYEIGSNKPLFADVDGTITHNILELSEERRHGYGWGGSWGKEIYIEETDMFVVTSQENRYRLFLNLIIGLVSCIIIIIIIRYKALKKRRRK